MLTFCTVACATRQPAAETIPTTIEATTTAPPTTAEVTTTTAGAATTTTAAADAAPPEMEGTWRTDLGNGDRVALTLRGTSYQITRGGNTGTGDISVDGDLIVFSGSSLCDGVGTYQWSVEGESLTFTPTESGDPCSGRLPVLNGVTYSR